MKITVLGNCGPYPGVGRACSGYLFESGSTKILLDCGNGVLSNLQKYCKIETLTHVILSHLHYDHMSDIMVLRYALESKGKRGMEIKPLKLYLPNEPKDIYEKIISSDIFQTNQITQNLEFNIGDLQLTFAKMRHPVDCYAVKIKNKDKVFVYSGDTAYSDAIINFAANIDMLLCDAGLLRKDKKDENVPHLTAYEAGLVGMKAKVKRLMLTHFWPEDDTNLHMAEAKENYPDAEAALEGETYYI